VRRPEKRGEIRMNDGKKKEKVKKFSLLYRFRKICKGWLVRTEGLLAPAMGETRMTLSLLGSATCSVQDFV